jgi:hypothetical protein
MCSEPAGKPFAARAGATRSCLRCGRREVDVRRSGLNASPQCEGHLPDATHSEGGGCVKLVGRGLVQP